ncbi:MAG: ABC transporter permease [Roseitalea sp.]|jgi:peptide/nickel transport system permease protein|nr:ABC transporter permease [Roseitalea sp.]MBO6721210.1 ABC transporter permease [Roseitalea sp.]MBO6744268.1 ABC transporter permease [Roseitalea sp.]
MAAVDHNAPVEAAPSPHRAMLRRALAHGGVTIGAGLLLIIIVMAVIGPFLIAHGPYDQDLTARLVPPIWMEGGSWEHPFGTDQLGRDYLARLLYGARISLMIGFGTVFIAGTIGTVLGVAAGYFGGRVDMVVTFLISVRLSTPLVLVALAVVSIVGGSLQVVVLVLGLLLWDRFAVVMRASTMQLRAIEYVTAARAIGCSTPRILTREIMPNVMNNLIVVTTLEMAHAILLEAVLSFLGLGVKPPTPSWGLMIAEGREVLLFEPWLITIPGLALLTLVLSINLVGDGIRDVTSPEDR